MSVKIRLKRIGRKKRPFYRVVVMDSRTRRDGREIELIGWYDPLQSKNKLHLETDRIIYWLGQGAIPSDTVSGMMKRSGISYRMHLTRLGKSEEEIAKEMEAWEAAKAARPGTEKNQPVMTEAPTIELVEEPAQEELPSDENSSDEKLDNTEGEDKSEDIEPKS